MAARVAGRPARLHHDRHRSAAQPPRRWSRRACRTSRGRRGFTHTPRAKLRRVKEGETPDYLQGALVAMDPTNGYVRALVGGRDFTESRFNRAMQAKRQSGSAFKPFVYAAALEAGYSPATLITRSERSDPDAHRASGCPRTSTATADSMTLRAALRTSSNRAAVQLLNTVGIPKAVELRGEAERRHAAERAVAGARRERRDARRADRRLRRLRQRRHRPQAGPDPARRGQRRQGALQATPGKSQRAVSEATAFLMASMLADVINAGTAYRARQSGFTLPAAGKTGTTNDYVDAWFVGFTPHLVTGVWVGFDQPKTIISQRLRRRARRAALGRLHEGGHARATSRSGSSARERRSARTSAACRASCRPAAATTSRSVNRDGFAREAVDDLHRVFRQGHAADRACVRCTQPRRSLDRWPASSARTRASPVSVDATRRLPPAPPARRAPPVPHRRPASARVPRKDRRSRSPRRSAASGRRVFGGGDDDKKKKRNGRKKEEREEKAERRDTILTAACRFAISSGIAHLLDLVARAAARGSLPPSLIFAGPDGVGKRLAARRAGAVAELHERRRRADGESRPTPAASARPARRIARGVHADVLVDRAGRHRRRSRSIRCATAIERTAYRPFEGRRRVVIVDEADAMVAAAQNALLKTLEEPPAASMFVLVTSRPDVLLPTVRSRCQRLRFGPLSPGGHRAGADARSRLRASATRTRPRRRPTAASAARSRATARPTSRRATPPKRCCRRRRRQPTPAQRLDSGTGAGRRQGRSRRAGAAAAAGRVDAARPRRAALAAPMSASLANADLKPVLARLLPAFDADRALRRVRRGRPRAAGARSQRQPEDRRGLAGVSVVIAIERYEIRITDHEDRESGASFYVR